MSKMIPRYDEDFFNCYMGHVISYLKHLDLPVELLFFKCLESTERIYEYFLVQGGDRWHFPTHFLDLNRLGARIIARHVPTFEEAKPEIQHLIDQGKVVFILCDGYYIPHRVESYHNYYQDHNFMLTGYRTNESGTQWFVEDHARPDFYDYYDESLIRDSYNLAHYPHAHQFGYFEFDLDQARNPDKRAIGQSFAEYVSTYTDDLSMLDRLLQDCTIHQADITQLPGGLQGTERALLYIASSRELFRRFVTAYSIEGELALLLKQSIDLAFGIRALVLRGRVRPIDLHKLETKCTQLQENETAILTTLVRHQQAFVRN